MRKILQCVPMNEVLKHPDDFLGYSYDYGLVGPAALGQVSATKGRQAVVALDENNAFTFIETPEYWWRFLGGPVVLCEDLPEEWPPLTLRLSELVRISNTSSLEKNQIFRLICFAKTKLLVRSPRAEN